MKVRFCQWGEKVKVVEQKMYNETHTYTNHRPILHNSLRDTHIFSVVEAIDEESFKEHAKQCQGDQDEQQSLHGPALLPLFAQSRWHSWSGGMGVHYKHRGNAIVSHTPPATFEIEKHLR